MPLQIQMGVTDEKFYVIGSDNSTPPIQGAQLGPGQTITIVSGDETIVTLPVDPTAQPEPINKIPTIASGGVTPVAVGGPVTCTWTVTNQDGSVAESDTDTVTVIPKQPGVATSIGVLFEENQPSPGTVTGPVAKKGK